MSKGSKSDLFNISKKIHTIFFAAIQWQIVFVLVKNTTHRIFRISRKYHRGQISIKLSWKAFIWLNFGFRLSLVELELSAVSQFVNGVIPRTNKLIVSLPILAFLIDGKTYFAVRRRNHIIWWNYKRGRKFLNGRRSKFLNGLFSTPRKNPAFQRSHSIMFTTHIFDANLKALYLSNLINNKLIFGLP